MSLQRSFVLNHIFTFWSAALQCLWGPGDYKLEIEEMLAEQAVIGEEHNKSVLDLLRDKHLHWQVLSVLVINSCIQFSGISAVNHLAFILNTQNYASKYKYHCVVKKHLRHSYRTTCIINIVIFYPSCSQITVFSFNIFLEAGIPVDKIRYVTLGIGASEVLISITCVSSREAHIKVCNLKSDWVNLSRRNIMNHLCVAHVCICVCVHV